MKKNILSPSILAADIGNLAQQVRAVEAAGAEYLHIDVMDGWFVPSLSFGLPTIASIRKVSGMQFDVHLMIEEPERYLEDFVKAGADILTVHTEACAHLDRTLREIRALGCRVGVALNPATPLSALDWVLPEVDMVLLMTVNPGYGGQELIPYVKDKVRALRQRTDEVGLETDIEVDGGVTLENVQEVLQAGANVVVAGSAVFRGDAAENVKRFREKMKSFDLK